MQSDSSLPNIESEPMRGCRKITKFTPCLWNCLWAVQGWRGHTNERRPLATAQYLKVAALAACAVKNECRIWRSVFAPANVANVSKADACQC